MDVQSFAILGFWIPAFRGGMTSKVTFVSLRLVICRINNKTRLSKLRSHIEWRGILDISFHTFGGSVGAKQERGLLLGQGHVRKLREALAVGLDSYLIVFRAVEAFQDTLVVIIGAGEQSGFGGTGQAQEHGLCG